MNIAYESSLELDETKVTSKSNVLDLEALKVLLVSGRSVLFVVAYIGHIGLSDIWRSAGESKGVSCTDQEAIDLGILW